jgi:hypothetical protein
MAEMRARKLAQELEHALAEARDDVMSLQKCQGALPPMPAIPPPRPLRPVPGKSLAVPVHARMPSTLVPMERNSLSKCARALLAVLAQRGSANDSQLAILSGYSKNSSGFANSLSELRATGLISGGREHIAITAEGRAAAGDVEALPTGHALLDYWMGKLGKCEAAFLREIYQAGGISKEALGVATGYSPTSSGFSNSLSKLRVLGLINGRSGGDLTIADVFTEDGQ